MRRRSIFATLAVLAITMGTNSIRAQEAYEPSPLSMMQPGAMVPAGAVEDLSTPGEALPVSTVGDPTYAGTVQCYDESCRSDACGPLNSYKRHLRGLPCLSGIGAHLQGCGQNSECDNYECANCYHRWDCEKRLYLGYVSGGAAAGATQVSVNDLDAAQVGAEFLPWVHQDGSVFFTRYGFTVMWQYSRFEGGSLNGQIQSQLSNGVIATDGGEQHSLILGPTYRVDFDFFGIRLSPNTTLGTTFDWINLSPTAANGGNNVSVERFKFNGFDAGFYGKIALDVGITEKINFSVGLDFRASHTDVMQNDEDLRKHLGLVLGMSHTF